MKLRRITLRRFRRLESVTIDLEDQETVFVGPNNSGKTSVSSAFRCFLGRTSFSIHDFPAAMVEDIDAFCTDNSSVPLPSIELDLWFSFDEDTEFGRVFSLVSNPSATFDEVGIRLRYSANNPDKLKEAYLAAFPSANNQKPLSHYLSLDSNLARHFAVSYSALETTSTELSVAPLDNQEGKRVLDSLLRIDFVDAQRNIHEQDMARTNRLSAAFAEFYKRNLEQAETSEEANRIIDENNDRLTKHYAQHFTGLMTVIQGLGVPSINDRNLMLVSSLRPEEALKGSTSLFYVDPSCNHQLPEAYNGLGFKNLIYIAIQISHFQLQWIRTDENRPLCQLIFIEEPEVHLHAQVQQTFISNIWEIVRATSVANEQPDMVPQLAITTHSSHILDSVEFGRVRYFRRCRSARSVNETILSATEVVSLREFHPTKTSASGTKENKDETLNFLRKYLRLTHCDLFFADAAILVEGAGEKLLLRAMIHKSAPSLKNCYVTVLEVGGAYASRFASLLEFLCIPYLVVTDIDSVDAKRGKTICRADKAGATTSNASLRFFFGKETITEFVKIQPKDQTLANGSCFVAFQKPTRVRSGATTAAMHGRTFEEAFIYDNIDLFRQSSITSRITLPDGGTAEAEYEAVFQGVSASSFKKTDFAIDVLTSQDNWQTPTYIAEGLSWLADKVTPVVIAAPIKKKKAKARAR